MHEAFEGFGGFIEGNLTNSVRDFVTTGTMDMKKLGQTIINEVIMSMLKALVLKPLLGAIGGAIGGGAGAALGGVIGGMRASGGPVKGGTSYLVGEQGPELFTPQTSGAIIDADRTAAVLSGDTATGAAGQQNIYNIDARGADQGAVARLEAALLQLAGPGVVEKRALAAEANQRRRR